jgi:hypothetical protein
MCAVAFAQESGRLEGTVTDPQGAAIPGAEIHVVNIASGQAFQTTSDERGQWVLPFMAAATYRVRVSSAGFKVATVENVKIDAGAPATVNVKLEIGAVSESVEVVAGAEVLQASSSAVSTTLTGRQVNQLPYVSRNLLDLIVSLPGTQTASTPRNSIIAGLPESTINITLDGVNVQDNLLKNSDGYFTQIQPRTEAIAEVSVTTAAGGADSIAEGSSQIRFVTKSGTNDFHGSLFWQDRNTFFNANNYFNNRDGLPRDRLILHQYGGSIGGPIKRNKLLFFAHFEAFRNPQTNNATRTVMTDDARSGIYTYLDSTNTLRRVNLYQIAAARNPSLPANVRQFATTPDPIIAATLAQIAQLSSAGGVLRSLASSGDYNRQELRFQAPGANNRNFPTLHLDWIVNSKHHVDFVYNYQSNFRVPDGLNGVLPIFPGTGAVVGSDQIVGQRGMKFSGVIALRSALGSRLTNELRAGLTGGNTLFRDEIAPAMFSTWRGYAPGFNYVTSPFISSTNSRRNSPVKQVNENLSWSRGGHLVSVGGSFTQVNNWTSITGSQNTPTLAFTSQTNDPLSFGTTSIFDTNNFPNSSAGQRNAARDLYILLTGRVGTITRSLALDEKTRKYGNVPFIDRNRQREWGVFVQDRWRITSHLTFNGGVRFQHQNPLVNLNGLYTRVGLEGLYGVSGVGNLFKPGTLTGQAPAFYPIEPGQGNYPGSNFVSPSLGVAWVLPRLGGPLSWLFGERGQTVFRAGYAIAINRGGLATISDLLGDNQGSFRTASVNPNNYPAEFGPPGSVWFRDSALPVRNVPTETQYPLPAVAGNEVNDFDPNLKNRYIPSWNISLQRQLGQGTVLEVSYIGNRAKRLWGTVNLNEVNIFENGFLNEFKIAQQNLAIARGVQPTSNNFGNQGLPGQRPIPIISTAFGTTVDQASALLISRGEVGELAGNISGNTARMQRLVGAGYPVNLFVVNPTINSAANLLTNGFPTQYDALQVELRRRVRQGLLVQGSWVWSHSFSSSVRTLRDLKGVMVPNGQDLRHAIKVNWLYDLPFGPGRRFLQGRSSGLARVLVEGWQLAGVARVQSGSPFTLSSSRNTFHTGDSGVMLYNITNRELQKLVQFRKETVRDPVTGAFRGVVYWLPQSIIDNTQAAFESNNRTLEMLDRSKPYIGPPTEPGVYGNRIILYGPWQNHWDLSVIKTTRIKEGHAIEFRAQFLNAFNLTNFFLANTNASGTAFGQTSSAYRDISNTNDSGGRLIEFVLRYTF